MFRAYSRNILLGSTSSSSSSSFRFIIPPGNLPLSILKRNRTMKQQNASASNSINNNDSSSGSGSISALAIRACGVETSGSGRKQTNQDSVDENVVENPNQMNNDSNNNEEETSSSPSPNSFNAADLTDEEVNRCLKILPKYADLATSRLSSSGSLRVLTRDRAGAPHHVHRTLIRELKLHLVKHKLLRLEEVENISLKEMKQRFGKEKVVREFLEKMRETFTVDVDKILSSSSS